MAMTLDGTSGITQMTGSIVMSGSTSGTTTIIPSAVAGTTTVTMPSATGTMMVSGNMPAFSAYASTNQTVSDATITKITFDTEEFDTNNNFASSRFTPTVAGYYQVNAVINFSQTLITDCVTWIFKNGGQYKRGFGFAGSGQSKFIAPITTLVYLNGSTDYVEVYLYSDGTGNVSVNGSSQDVWFNGSLVRGA